MFGMEFMERSPSYYSILGISSGSSDDEIRQAYRKLAMQWHPDRWTRKPSLLGQANQKFQQIQEAYSVLSDKRKRTMYDAGLYDPDEEEDEGFCDFLQEMTSLMDEVRREGKIYSIEELQGMLMEMAQGFEFPHQSSDSLQWPVYEAAHWFSGSSAVDESIDIEAPNRPRWETPPMAERSSRVHVSGFGPYGTTRLCS